MASSFSRLSWSIMRTQPSLSSLILSLSSLMVLAWLCFSFWSWMKMRAFSWAWSSSSLWSSKLRSLSQIRSFCSSLVGSAEWFSLLLAREAASTYILIIILSHKLYFLTKQSLQSKIQSMTIHSISFVCLSQRQFKKTTQNFKLNKHFLWLIKWASEMNFLQFQATITKQLLLSDGCGIFRQMAESYFEQQSMLTLLCGMHTLNNILAGPIFTRQRLNDICYTLSDSFVNPHKHVFGGDYDANVLLLALQQEQCTTKWHDHRKQFAIHEHHQEQPQLELIGYIINRYQGEGILNKIFRFSSRHWTAVRRQGNIFHFLDSKQESFESLKKADAQERINKLLKENQQPQERTEVIEVYRLPK